MKTRIFKKVFPLMAFVLAITGAFAFKPAPKSEVTNWAGAKKVGVNECQITTVQCTDVIHVQFCTDAGANLYRMLGPTSCPDQLYKI
jgi:hypothetical protein